MEVAIVAAGNAIPLHQVDDLLAAITLIERGVVEKAEFFLLPPGLQGRLQPNQLPVENLGAVPLPVLLIKPSPGPAQGDVPIEMAVIVEQMECGKSIFLEEPLHFGGGIPPVVVIALHQQFLPRQGV